MAVRHTAGLIWLVVASLAAAEVRTVSSPALRLALDGARVTRIENRLTGEAWGAAATLPELSGVLRWQDGRHLVEGDPQLDATPDGQEIVLVARGAAASPGVYGTRWALTGLDAAAVQVLLPAGGAGAAFSAACGRDADFTYGAWEGWEMQLAIVQGERGGLAIWTEDVRGLLKAVRVRGQGNAFALAFDSHEPAPFGDRLSAVSVPWRLAAYQGDWRVPAARYREWMRQAWRPAGYQPPGWVNDIGLVVNFGPSTQSPEAIPILEELARHTAPAATLLNVPNWRTDGFDVNYPNYVAAPGFDRFVARAHELGFRVMPYTNLFGCDVRNPLYAQLKQFQVRDAFSGEPLGWHWTEPQHPNRFAYINHASSRFRAEIVRRLKAIRDEFGVDAIHLDQSIFLFNDANGLIEGLTHGEGRLRLHWELAAAMPGVAFAGEEIGEMCCGVENFAQRFPPESRDAFAPHPLLAYLYAPFTRPVRHYNCTPHSTVGAGELGSLLQSDAEYGMVPTVWADSVEGLRSPTLACLLDIARFHQRRGLRSDEAPWPTGAVHAFRTRDGRQLAVSRTPTGLILADGETVAWELVSGVTRLERPGSVVGGYAYDQRAVFGLNPGAVYLYRPTPRDLRIPHLSYLSGDAAVTTAATDGAWLTATLVDLPLRQAVFDLAAHFDEATLGILFEDVREGPIDYGAYFRVGKVKCGGVVRPAIESNPPWSGTPTWGNPFAEFSVALPAGPEPLTLRFAYGRLDASQESDGITFRVLVDGKELFRQHTAEKKWHEAAVDLSAYAGNTVKLRFISDIGPAHNNSWDFAGWAEPVVRRGRSEAEVGFQLPGGIATAFTDQGEPLVLDPASNRVAVPVPARVTVVGQAPPLALPADLAGLPFAAYLDTDGSLSRGGVYGSGTQSELDVNGDRRAVILGHPPMFGWTVLRYHVALPASPAKLSFASSLRYTQPADGDGLRFRVVCNGRELWSREARDAGWVSASVSLAPFAGRTVLLDLVTDSITRNWHDHCGWADLKITAE